MGRRRACGDWSILGSVDAETGFPLRIGNTSGLPPPSARAASRTSSARLHSGTRCSRFIFIRWADSVHTRPGTSISSHVASLASADRAAVSTRNSNASLTTGAAPDARTVSMAAATSLWGSASRCVTMLFCGPSAGRTRSQGLSCRMSNAMAHSITERMRWRTARAVSALVCQIGVRISRTSAVSTSETGRLPMRGKAYRSRLRIQFWGCHRPRLADHVLLLEPPVNDLDEGPRRERLQQGLLAGATRTGLQQRGEELDGSQVVVRT